MSTTLRVSVLLLMAVAVAVALESRPAFAQRIVIGGSNQSNKDKKDNDKDKDKDNDNNNNRDRDKDKNKNDQNTQGGNSSKSDGSSNSNNSGNSSTQQKIQQFIQNRNDKDKKNNQGPTNQGPNNQGQGGSPRVFNPNQPGFPGNNNNSNQNLITAPAGGNATQRFGSWRGDRWEGTHKADNWAKAFGQNNQPFSSNWYKDHPSAWKYDNNKANVWVVATVPGVYSWLGWGSVPKQYGVNYGTVERFDPSYYGDWYPLGVYSLMSGEGDPGTRIVQLAVDRRGNINGNYFDMITSANNMILGNVDRDSQRVDFWLNRNPSVRFRASVFRLLQPYGNITVQLPAGEQRWQFVRLEN